MDLHDKNKNLIRKYISGDYTPEEWNEIRLFMLMPAARQTFDEVLAEQWTGLDAEQDLEQPGLNHQLRLFYTKLEDEESNAHTGREKVKSISRSINTRRLFQYAAVWLVVLFGAGGYALSQFNKTPVQEHVAMRELFNPNGQRSRILLPDSSHVFLGAGSKLSFPEKFNATNREVKLEGSAFFEVTKNPKRPFIIHTGTIQTRVLGTSFKIEAYKNRPVTVAVATGKVRVDDFLKDGMKTLAMLTPGQMITYDKGVSSKKATDINELQSWKDGRLSFHGQTLQEITTELERWYDVKIEYKHPSKAKEKISVVLQVDMPLQKIMKVLAATGHFKFKIAGKQVRINEQ